MHFPHKQACRIVIDLSYLQKLDYGAMDTRTPEQRNRIMKAVKTKHTGPELAVRRILHGEGYRYRLHAAELPGKPDIVFRPKKKVIFVHGCFWHGHGCSKGRLPKSRLDYWTSKIVKNIKRDRANKEELESLGWQVLTVWQCEIASPQALRVKLIDFVEALKNPIDSDNAMRYSDS